MKTPIFMILTVLLISGCTAQSFDATELAKTNEVVKSFLSEYPNAQIIGSYVRNAEIALDCQNPQLETKDYWNVNIFDGGSNLTVNVWVDADSHNILCVIKTGGSQQNLDNETMPSGCYEKYDCDYDEYCSGGLCKKLICQIGYHAENHECEKDGESSATYLDVSVDDDAVLGDPGAPLTMIEFGDYQCQYCKRHFQQTYPQLKSEYIDKGKLKFVFRDFPLSFHYNAQKAAEGAECAGDQGKYWEMYDMLFKYGGTSPDSMKRYATQIGLDTENFSTCLDSGRNEQEVQKDLADGIAAEVIGTPSFFIGTPEKGYQLVVGAQPYSVFKQIIDNWDSNENQETSKNTIITSEDNLSVKKFGQQEKDTYVTQEYLNYIYSAKPIKHPLLMKFPIMKSPMPYYIENLSRIETYEECENRPYTLISTRINTYGYNVTEGYNCDWNFLDPTYYNRTLKQIKISFDFWSNLTGNKVIFYPVTDPKPYGENIIKIYLVGYILDEYGYIDYYAIGEASPTAYNYDNYSLIVGGEMWLTQNAEEFTGVIIHETGHLMGMAHDTSLARSIMYPIKFENPEYYINQIVTQNMIDTMKIIYQNVS